MLLVEETKFKSSTVKTEHEREIEFACKSEVSDCLTLKEEELIVLTEVLKMIKSVMKHKLFLLSVLL